MRCLTRLIWAIVLLPALTQAGTKWARTYGGGHGTSQATSIQATSDGGFIFAGYTDSFGAGMDDVWVLKLDSSGLVEWANTYGGFDEEQATSVRQTSDGGYIVAGWTKSFGTGQEDALALKLNPKGKVLWQKTYGYRDSAEWACSIHQTGDGGYILAGTARASGTSHGDIWILKLNTSGNVTWQNAYGDCVRWGLADQAFSMQETKDGGYVVAGYTELSDAWGDAIVLKLSSSGGIAWVKSFGIKGRDEVATSVQQTRDGGFIVTGSSDNSYWAAKLSSTGSIAWQKTFSDSHFPGWWPSVIPAIQQTQDGGYVIAGEINDRNGDAWLAKLTSSGGIAWQKAYGGNGANDAYSISVLDDGDYVFAGSTYDFSAGFVDAWVLRVGSSGEIGVSCGSLYRTTSVRSSNASMVSNTPAVAVAKTTVSAKSAKVTARPSGGQSSLLCSGQ